MSEITIHEIRKNLFSGRFYVALILMVFSFIISLSMMSQEYENRMENYYESKTLPASQLFWNKTWYWKFDDENITNSDNLTWPMGLVKAPQPLVFVARGMDKQMRQSVEFFTTFPIIDITIMPDQEVNLMRVIFSSPDLLFIMKVLVSLLAILFSFNMIVEEREQGTLKLMMVNGASRGSIFLGKYLGGLLSIWTAFTASFLVYVLALDFLTPVEFSGETPMRLVLIFLTSLLHIAVFFSMGAAISAFFRNSAPALIVSLFVWLIVVFAMPGLSALIAQQYVKVESAQTINRMKLEKAQQMERDYEEANPDDENISNTGGYGRRHDAIRDEINMELAKIDDEHQRRKRLQEALTTNLSRISPVGSLTYLYTSLSKNGLEDLKMYQQNLVTMREMINEEITKMLQDPNFGRLYVAGEFSIPDELKNEAFKLIDIGETVPFTHLTLEETLATTWLDFLLLSLFAIILMAIAFIRFLSYDAR